MNSQEKKRVCKICDEVKNMTMFPITQSKKSKNMTYRHTCKDCEKSKRRLYFKDYHKKHYIGKKNKNEEKVKENVIEDIGSDSEIDIQ